MTAKVKTFQQESAKSANQVLSWLVPRLFAGSMEDAVEEIARRVRRRSLTVIFTPNPEQVELAERNSHFAQSLAEAHLLFPDGIGLIWAAGRRGRQLDRVTGREVLEAWLARPKATLPRTLLLGGAPHAAATVARVVDPSGHRVQGMLGFQDVANPTAAEQAAFRKLLKQWQPQVIFVGFGAPRQETWIMDQREMLKEAGVKVVMVVGGAFDILSGQLAAPPDWVVRAKLEWLFRLLHQPARWRRQIWLVRFVWRVLRTDD